MSLEDIALKYALANAVKYGGRANPGAVMSKIMAEMPELRPRAREVKAVVEAVVEKVNAMSLEEQKALLASRWPEALEEKKKAEEKRPGIESLQPLPEAEKGVVVRFAPNPDFVLHLGSARPAILNYAYRLKYGGKFILRFEDTDPRIKRPLVTEEVNAYDAIREDLKWLGVRPDEEYIQSSRMEIYYEYAKKLIELGGAYVDLCKPEEWRRLRNAGKACPHREQSADENLELWEKMLRGDFGEGEAVLRVKTDLAHPDPSVRDWVAFRIIDTSKAPHPLVGDKYIVWPTYNFAVSIDDHLMGVTHVLRAQEHSVNTTKQSYIFKHFGWRQPVTIHFGRLKIEGGSLSKSKLKALKLKYDDITLPTLAGLRNRGILPEAIWELILSVGIKPSDSTVSMANLYAINRKLLDPRANRYMFVADPVKLYINLSERRAVKLPMHPGAPERGYRTYELGPGEISVYISRRDLGLGAFRLMEFINAKVVGQIGDGYRAEPIGASVEEARRLGLPIIQWVPEGGLGAAVVRPEGIGKIVREEGLVEPHASALAEGEAVQFVRYGFVKLSDKKRLTFTYIHE
ncbi:MAG: glutamate--tRNA ligase [Thermoproteus sp. AZ2]|jgi:glutamyl-tRNA synthetase|uniref:Glutamate--tRNA ligase n=1 Tax=Thermoproteus sp. AZ2 TaxID=1609232 RepID=A0ACC6UZ04_9CREN|nr:MAG: glutamyl-tRNA synthetase [Thermoproteus sp. AZ2]